MGDPDDALHYYLIDLDAAENVPDAGVKNTKLLWARGPMTWIKCSSSSKSSKKR